MDRRVSAGFVLAGVALAVALVRGASDFRRRAEPPAWRNERSFAGVVEIRGAVRRRGVLPGQAGCRARDAIAAAGPQARVRRGDADRRLREGDAVTLLPDGTVRVGRMPGERLVALGRRIDPNLATAGDLASLPGIGPVTAARIVAWREATGPFGALEDLGRVPGIGPKTLARVRPHLSFAGPIDRTDAGGSPSVPDGKTLRLQEDEPVQKVAPRCGMGL